MLELFNNPGFLAAGSAVVSAPVIIHLINRMRFRRLRWAAMEFLLKAQKRNRRRLIIEQLLLLALRCLLIILALLMVSRFTGCTRSYFMQEGLHIVVFDDSLSMTDQWKEGSQDKNSFKAAKDDVIMSNIVKKVAQSTTNERLVILPLSALVKSAAGAGSSDDPATKSPVYQKLAERATEEAIKDALDKMQPTKLHAEITVGLDAANNLIEQNPGKRPIVHVVSDFRLTDWSGEAGDKLKKSLEKLAKNKAELRLWDAGYPGRLEDQGGVPKSNDNVAIVDFKANSRLVGKRMPVTFSVTVANNSPNDKKVNAVIYRYESRINPEGKEEYHVKEQLDLNFVPAMPFNVPANGTAVATFKYTPENVKEGAGFYSEKFAVSLEALRGPLDDDGLLADNIRFASVQIRNKIPILIIDGDGSGSDATTYVETAIKAISDSYDISYGDLVSNSPDATEVLRTGKLNEYAAIYLLNVEKLTDAKKGKEADAKLKNLESYVKDGGSVMFFLGPKVSGKYYTDKLYRKGAGLFPAPLNDAPTYNADVDPSGPLAAKNLTFGSQLLLRDDKTASLEDLPIFGKMIAHKSQQERLKLMNVIKHFTVPRTEWGQGEGIELATLPNKKTTLEAGLDAAVGRVLDVLDNVMRSDESYKKFEPVLKPYIQQVRDIILSAQAYQVGQVLDAMLNDKADPTKPDALSSSQFWTLKDPNIGKLRKEIKDIVDQSVYGDPFVVARQFGKGRVVAVMSTAGSGWNDWGHGLARDLWPLFQKYSLNYLFDQTAESSLLVGAPYSIEIKTQKYLPPGAKQLKAVRTFYEAKVNQPVKFKETIETGTVKDGVQTFTFTNNYDDGFYVTNLYSDLDDGKPIKKPLETWEHIFNVDTKTESKLQRVSQEEAKYNVLGKDYKDTKIRGGFDPNAGEVLINKQNDLADSPWFFLVFLLVLVCEQALAVHLSHHMRGGEGELPAEAVTSQLRAA